MTLNSGLFTSNKDDWETPQSLFDRLNNQYHFEVDLAATDSNHKCDKYFTKECDSLLQDWKLAGGVDQCS